MKRLFILIALFLFSVSLNSAFLVETDFKNDVYIIGFESDIDVVVSLSELEDGYYNVYTLSDVLIEPSDFYYLTDEEVLLNYTFTPYDRIKTRGDYLFNYYINHKDVEQKKILGKIRIFDFEDVINIESNFVDFENPVVKVYIENKENYNFKNLKMKCNSILSNFESDFNLSSYEIKEIELNVSENLIKTTKAGVYAIDCSFDSEAGLKEVQGKLYLSEKEGIVTQDEISGFLIRTRNINKINSGNTVEDIKIIEEKNWFSGLFTSFNNEPNKIDKNGSLFVYEWSFRLNPGDVYNIKIKTNYFYPLIFLCLIIFVYFMIRKYLEKKIDIKKTVRPVKTKNGEFALRVNLNIKARKDIQKGVLIDRVPLNVKIYNNFKSNAPDFVDVEKRILKWNIGDLNSGEERVFSYIVYSRVGFVGKFSLPSARISFDFNETACVEESKKVFFLTENESTLIKD